MSVDAADEMGEIDRTARANLNVVDLARYDIYKKRLLADGSDRANDVRALRAYISISIKVEDEDARA